MHCTSWYHFLNDTSVLPGMASPLKVFIWGVPSCNPVARVFIMCPTSSSGWVGAEGQGGCPLHSHPPSGCGRGSKWLFWGFPPSPSWKGDLLVIQIGIPISHRISPRCWWWVSGECIQLLESDLLAEILHELSQPIICKIPKVCLQLVWGPPTQVRVTRG